MNAVAQCFIAGQPVPGEGVLEVRDPYRGDVVGTVETIGMTEVELAVASVGTMGASKTRRDVRAAVLERTRELLQARAGEFAELIRRESGLCQHDAEREVQGALDVLRFAAIEALHDDGQVFAGDVTSSGKARKIFTTREPVRLVAAITPFNQPLNQVVHKIAPAIAAGAPMILKPSEKTPLTALRFAAMLYEAGLPGEMLSVLVGPVDEVVEPLVRHRRTELVSFTGTVAVGKRIASIAGYKRLCLELGGNSPLIVLADADLDLAARLAAEGSFGNSGQHCMAVERILVHRDVVEPFAQKLAANAANYPCGDPADPATRVGTVIDEAAAQRLEALVRDVAASGARVLCGGGRRGAQIEPTVLVDVPRHCEMVREESFGPLAPIVSVDGVDDAIGVANATPFGLAAAVVTNDIEAALRCVREVRAGTVNVNEVPGYRTDSSPSGGVKDSGLGVKQGVVEAAKFMTTVKTFSLPW